MASTSQAAGDARSGGKILKSRRTAARNTPYDRPTPVQQPESPNWFNGLVSPAKFVAGGATKLLSSFWNPKGWASRSNSSSESDSDSEGVIEDDNEDNEKLSDVGDELNQTKGSSSGKSEILHLVEQLLMLESFSREECDRLIEIVNSRAVECTMRDGMETELKNPDNSNQAITEARKLITKNMVGSSSKSDLDSIHGSKSQVTPNRDYLSGGTWNIQDEVRRLRSKATEDMLSKYESPKLAAVEHDISGSSSLANEKGVGLLKPSSLGSPKPVEETVDLAADGGSLGFTDTRSTRDILEALPSLPTIEEQNQTTEDQDAASNLGLSEDVNRLNEGICDLITESHEVPDVNVNGSQGSSNTNDPISSSKKTTDSPTTRAMTRSRRTSNRGRGRGRAK
ncbi:hypothetical protein OSB04_030155 [Centaurea solstitialis]|uniref:Uncharacterized protein n=1 Tax=Centaurea solstitialis TaxID=347529 RepID=A0AA38VWF4_9ASTR|nr:hypothetical protein OSB04_030155 [Centaurea solstitialis]